MKIIFWVFIEKTYIYPSKMHSVYTYQVSSAKSLLLSCECVLVLFITKGKAYPTSRCFPLVELEHSSFNAFICSGNRELISGFAMTAITCKVERNAKWNRSQEFSRRWIHTRDREVQLYKASSSFLSTAELPFPHHPISSYTTSHLPRHSRCPTAKSKDEEH